MGAAPTSTTTRGRDFIHQLGDVGDDVDQVVTRLAGEGAAVPPRVPARAFRTMEDIAQDNVELDRILSDVGTSEDVYTEAFRRRRSNRRIQEARVSVPEQAPPTSTRQRANTERYAPEQNPFDD